MTDIIEIVIGQTEYERVTIRVLGRMHPGADDFWDGNWLITPLTARVGAFRADVEGRPAAGLRGDELKSFRQELQTLYERLDGRAELRSLEGWLSLDLVGDGVGHIRVEGEMQDRAGEGNRLSFRLELDQTFLPPIIESLRAVEATYPLLGAAENDVASPKSAATRKWLRRR